MVDQAYYGLEELSTTHAEVIGKSYLELLKNLRAYNSNTKVLSMLTESWADDGRSLLESLIQVLSICVDKGFIKHYFYVEEQAQKNRGLHRTLNKEIEK